MSSRDLVDAAAFHRRRLVAAFLTGRAEPHAPPRPGRRVAAGALLAGLLTAGAALSGLPAVAAYLPWR